MLILKCPSLCPRWSLCFIIAETYITVILHPQLRLADQVPYIIFIFEQWYTIPSIGIMHSSTPFDLIFFLRFS